MQHITLYLYVGIVNFHAEFVQKCNLKIWI